MNVAGEYTYCLDVCDAQHCSNDAQCATTACKKVTVFPCGPALHVELTWETPGDLDPTDTGPDAGADLDLHFLDPQATGPDLDGDGQPDGWFDLVNDTFWFNPQPDWGSADPNAGDNPGLDRDDSDGWGPENLNYQPPSGSGVYRIGVHDWDDHGFGISYPRLKVYIWGQLVFDRNLKDLGQPLLTCDLWEAATVEWPSGAVKAVDLPSGGLKITHAYQNTTFAQIGGTCGNAKP